MHVFGLRKKTGVLKGNQMHGGEHTNSTKKGLSWESNLKSLCCKVEVLKICTTMHPLIFFKMSS